MDPRETHTCPPAGAATDARRPGPARSRRRTRLRVTATPTRRDGPRDRGGRRVRRAEGGVAEQDRHAERSFAHAPTSSPSCGMGRTATESGQADSRRRPLRRRAAKNGATRPRRHAMTEAVPLGPLPGVGLIGALHSLPPRPETAESPSVTLAPHVLDRCTSIRVMSSGTLLHHFCTMLSRSGAQNEASRWLSG